METKCLFEYFNFIHNSNIEFYIDKLSSSVNIERLNNHPVNLTEDEIKLIYRKIFNRHFNA